MSPPVCDKCNIATVRKQQMEGVQVTDDWLAEVTQGAVVLTVNQRLARHLTNGFQLHCADAGHAVWETPDILPLSSWLSLLHRECLASGITTRTLPAAIAQQRLWRQSLLADRDSQYLLDIDAAAANAHNAWRIQHRWRCATGHISSVDHMAFDRWRRHYIQQCNSASVVDDATLADHIIELLASHADQITLPSKILLAGFIELDPQTRAVIDALRNAGVLVDSIAQTRNATVSRQVQADDETGLLDIAGQIHAQLLQFPKMSIGLVVPDLHARRAEVARAFDATFFPARSPAQISALARPYDLSLGLPLTEYSVVRTALLLLRLCVSKIDDTQLSVLLLSPYIIDAESAAGDRGRLDRKLREKRMRFVSLFGLIKELPSGNGLRKSLEKVSKRKTAKRSGTSVWADYFGAVLNDLGWPGQRPSSDEYQCIEAWHACLDDLQVLDDGEQLTLSDAFALLERLCRERVFQLQTPATPIQIMGRLESRGLTFDKLWVCGMDAEQWPPVGTASAFIPIVAQADAGVPEASANTRLAMATQEYESWQSSCDELVVCHSRSRDALDLLPASIVAELPEAQLPDVQPLPTTQTIAATADFELLEDSHGPAVSVGGEVRGGARLLENQASCPFKAFATHRLAINPLEEAQIGLDPRQHGSLLHEAVESFWTQTKTHTALMAMDAESLQTAIDSAIDVAFEKTPIEPALVPLQRRHLQRLLADWIEQCERGRVPFEVVELESERVVDVGGVRIKLKVDRIDRLQSGQTIIVDYKTGQDSNIKSWSEPRIESPQLPLYAVSGNQDVDGVCFAQVYPHKYKFIGVASEADLVPNVKPLDKHFDNWEAVRVHWRNALENIAQEVQLGVATITPGKNACLYCSLASLCRIDSNAVDEDAEQDDYTTTEGVSAAHGGGL